MKKSFITPGPGVVSTSMRTILLLTLVYIYRSDLFFFKKLETVLAHMYIPYIVCDKRVD